MSQLAGIRIPHLCTHHRVWYADRHWCCPRAAKFSFMRYRAKQRGLYVPSYDELEFLRAHLDRMKCPVCNKRMVWFGDRTNKRRITLDHKHKTDAVRLICYSCNCSEGGNSHVSIDDHIKNKNGGRKRCYECKQYKPFSEFQKNKRKRFGLEGRCRKCHNLKVKERYWRYKNAGNSNP